VRPWAFDVVGDGRRTQREHEVAAAEHGDDLLAHGRQEAGELRMVLGKPQRADIGAVNTRAR